MTGSAYTLPTIADGMHALRSLLNDLLHGPMLSTTADRTLGRHHLDSETTRLLPQITITPPDDDPPPEPNPELWALIERAKAGEAEAYGLIYDRYVDMVFRYIYFRVGNRTVAEDLTSDTFLRALKRISSFVWQGRDIGAWFVTIARNLVADHYKSGRYRLEVIVADMVATADREAVGYLSHTDAVAVERVSNTVIYNAIKQLNPEQQECIILRFLQGFTVAEAAAALGRNEGALKALQYRAVRNLSRLLPKELLEEYGW